MSKQEDRINRFTHILSKTVNETSLLKIVEGYDKYPSFNQEQQAFWWKNTITKMEKEIGKDQSIKVMNQCGKRCCGTEHRETASKLMDESETIEEFLQKLSKHDVEDGELEYKLLDENTIICKYNKCFCDQVNKSKELFISDTYCHCSVEFNRQLFKAAFKREVEVKLLQSILNGDNCCKFSIICK